VLEGKDKDSLYRHSESELRQIHEDFSQSVEIFTPGEDYMYIFQQDGATSLTTNVTQELP
jgi:hypothetical protein